MTEDSHELSRRTPTGSAEEQALHALLTHPRPDHGHAELERFQAAFRRPPKSESAAGPLPALDLDEVRDLLRQALAAELEPTSMPLESLAVDDSPDEIARQTAEVLWQSLVMDSRG